jgi:hypothetical protein
VSSDKIPKIRRRLGLPYSVSYYQTQLKEPVFTKTRVYACIKTKRSADETLSREFHRIQEAVYLLASSQFDRDRRRRVLFGGLGATTQNDEYVIIENNGQGGTHHWQRLDPSEPYRLNKIWKSFLKRHFFLDLIKILNQDIKIDGRWRYTIRQAALLAGQSQFAPKIWEAFLYNMIAIETLLVNRRETIQDVMIDRFVALFGWLKNERLEEWKEKFNRLYYLRNEFVHSGDIREITIKDLMDADEILGNLLINICKFTKLFKSKRDIIDLSNKLEARRILGMKPLDRQKGITYSIGTLSESESKEFERNKLWWQ